jgi:hypothetical protein
MQIKVLTPFQGPSADAQLGSLLFRESSINRARREPAANLSTFD